MHALIIEDEPRIGLMIEEELSDLGFVSFDRAVTEEDAVRMAEHTCPTLITAVERLA